MNILIVGGAGYVGSHTCKQLFKEGYTPIVYDNLSRGSAELVKWGVLEIGDLSDERRLSEVIAKYNPVAVMHFAAYAYVAESMQCPSKYYGNNVVGSYTLFELLRKNGILNVIFSSSCATYGIAQESRITEEHRQLPINPYGRSKLMVEQLLQDFDDAYGMKSITLRYFNAGGADPDLDIGEIHNPEPHVIPSLIRAALDAQAQFTVNGTDFETKDGTCVRDYVHVSDLARAHTLALKHLIANQSSDIFNLGNGEGFSVAELIETVQEITGKSIKIRYGERRHGDPGILVCDPTKAQKELLWTTSISDIKTVVNTAYQWHLKRHIN